MYLRDAVTHQVATPQSEPMRADQVANSAGGYAWAVDDWARLRRFLVLGTEGGSYYAGERKLTTANLDAVKRCIADDGPRAVVETVAISEAGRAPKNDPAILVLALCASADDVETRRAALASLSRVCRIGTHLFAFCEFVNALSGWGRAKRNAVAGWYDRADVAYQLVKYRQRNGWTHRDVFRLAHPSNLSPALADWVCGREADELPGMIRGFLAAQSATSPAETARLVREHGLTREMVLSDHLADAGVWAALLEKMPMTAMVRNLGNMSKVGLLTPGADAVGVVCERLSDPGRIMNARIHPIAALSALRTYATGAGMRGSGTWPVVPQVVDALDGAFYLAFGSVEPTGKRLLLALDVSGSMGGGEIAGVPGLTPRMASAAMALVTAAVEPSYSAWGFSTTFMPLALSARQRLDDAVRMVSGLPFAGTDCSLPMLHAEQKGLSVDAFIVYTDSETWAGRMHPAQALAQYRKATGIPAQLIVVGMVANQFSIADPNDAGMMDVVGFDTATPNVMGEFIAGRI